MKNVYLKNLVFVLCSMFLASSYAQVNSQIQWRKNYGGRYNEFPGKIVQTMDGGYVYCVTTDSDDKDVHGLHGSDYDVWVVKLKANGDTAWTKAYGGTDADWGKGIVQTPDSGFVFIADIYSSDGDIDTNYGSWDFWVVKIDKLGAIQWKKTYGGTSYEEVNGIIQNADGTFIVGGYSESNDVFLNDNNGSSDFWVFKLDANGNMIWQKNYGGNGDDLMYSMSGKDDVVYLAGTTWSDDTTDGDVTQHEIGYYDYWVLKIDTAGNKLWNKRFGSTGEDISYGCTYTSDKGVIVAGKAGDDDGDVDTTLSPGYYDGWIVKLDSAGNLEWKRSYGGNYGELFKSIIQTKEGGYFAAGYSYSDTGMVGVNHGQQDLWVVKIKPNGDPEWYDTFGGSSYDGDYYWGRPGGADAIETDDGGYMIATSTESNNTGDVGASKGWQDVWLVKLKCSPAFDAEICLVTFDSLTRKNKVVWEDAGYPGYVHSVNVYRETGVTNVYSLIGNVLTDSLSEYVDTAAAIDPRLQTYKYKIAAVDSCGNESDTSSAHGTVVLTASPSGAYDMQLIWNGYFGFVPSSYKVYRYTNSAPTPTLIATRPHPPTPMVDNAAPQSDSAKYYVVIVPPTSCTSSKNYNEGRSNTSANAVTALSIEEGSFVKQLVITPNPSQGMFNVSMTTNSAGVPVVLQVFNVTGQSVYETTFVSTGAATQYIAVDLKDTPKGVYFLNVQSNADRTIQKIVIH